MPVKDLNEVEMRIPANSRNTAPLHTFRRVLKYKYECEDIHIVPIETDGDANTAWNVLTRSLTKLGAVYSEDTPVETVVPAQRVVEAGSPALTERDVG